MIPIQYFLRIKNVGDRFSPDIVRSLSGKETAWTRDLTTPHLLGIGSILGSANKNSYVWGSGIMNPTLGTGDPTPSKVLALRGKLSHRELSRALQARLPDIPLGDPGFFSNLLLKDPLPQRQNDLAVIPHYVDQLNPYVQELSKADGIKILDVHQEPQAFISTLAQCRYAISSSLHGLVFSEALGIPNAWVEFSDLVAGNGFKFHDWFSLAKRPQKSPISIDRARSVSELLSLCELHEMDIDRSALSDALNTRIEEIEPEFSTIRSFHTLLECRSKPIPVFVISFNRGDQLLRAINSYRNLTDAVEIVIHDNGSSDKPTLDILDRLEKDGIQVFRSNAISTPDDLENINETIDKYFCSWGEPSRYVVTDCDIDLIDANRNILSIFDLLLDNFRDAACVGPMLTIHDIPASYALRNHAINRHIDQFWQKDPSWFMRDEIRIAYQRAPIDTTFALYRAGERFRRLQYGLRVYYPYEARHLDWYDDAVKGEAYRATSSPAISHWNSQAQIDATKDEPLRFSHYIRIVRSSDGELIAQSEDLKRDDLH